MTPTHFVLLFCRPAGQDGSGGFDRVEAVRKYNDERGRRGLKPIVPSWM